MEAKGTSVQKRVIQQKQNKQLKIKWCPVINPIVFLFLTLAFTDCAIFSNLLPDSPFPSQAEAAEPRVTQQGGRWGGRGDGAGLSSLGNSLKQSATVSAHALQRLARGTSSLHGSASLQARRFKGRFRPEAVRFHLDAVRKEIGVGVTLRHQ